MGEEAGVGSGSEVSLYAYYALHKLHIRPSEWVEMEENEKAFIIAAIDEKQKADEKARKEAERKANRGR